MKCEICGKIIWLWRGWTSKFDDEKKWSYDGFTFWEQQDKHVFAHKKCVKRRVEEEHRYDGYDAEDI